MPRIDELQPIPCKVFPLIGMVFIRNKENIDIAHCFLQEILQQFKKRFSISCDFRLQYELVQYGTTAFWQNGGNLKDIAEFDHIEFERDVNGCETNKVGLDIITTLQRDMFLCETGSLNPSIIFLSDVPEEFLGLLHMLEACNEVIYRAEKILIDLKDMESQSKDSITSSAVFQRHIDEIVDYIALTEIIYLKQTGSWDVDKQDENCKHLILNNILESDGSSIDELIEYAEFTSYHFFHKDQKDMLLKSIRRSIADANDISLEKFDEGDDHGHETETTYVHKKIVELMNNGKQIIIPFWGSEELHMREDSETLKLAEKNRVISAEDVLSLDISKNKENMDENERVWNDDIW